MSCNIKKLKKNAFRVTKERNVTALRVRVPGGHMEAKHFTILQEIAEEYGNGTVHLTTRQGFELPGIPFDKIEEVNQKIAPVIEGLELSLGVDGFVDGKGYPAAGTRNVSACIGNRVCKFANYDTTSLAQRIEKAIFPNDYHVKIALTGCPNDCIKAHMQDYGIIGQVMPEYDSHRCIGCGACVKNCQKRVTGALEMENYKVVRDHKRCVGCGECITKCPSSAWSRGQQLFRLVIMGRTGKRNPRLARTFLDWVTADVVVQVIVNTYPYIDRYIDRSLGKEHVGYIVDRTGYQVFKQEVLEGVKLNPEAMVAEHIPFGGYQYESNNNMVPASEK